MADELDRIGRREDYATAQRGLRSSDPIVREKSQRIHETIKRELSDGYYRSMRQSLIREARAGNSGNVKDIQDDDRLRR